MSEEVLKALMQLFALIVKQGSGVQQKEVEYVHNFLVNQLNEASVPEYMDLFYEYADINSDAQQSAERRSPSVRDSVRILGICKKINRTLTQKQKIIVVVRLFELLDSDKKFTFQRMTIIHTVAEVFNISRKEFDSIEMFIRDNKSPDLEEFKIIRYTLDPTIRMSVTDKKAPPNLSFLWVESADLFFLKHSCNQEVFLNGLVITTGKIYLFSNGSSIHAQSGRHIYYSDVASRFRKDAVSTHIRFEVKDLSYRFPGGAYGIQNISFVEHQGRLVSIMGASGTGKTTLINLLSGSEKPSEGQIYVNGHNLELENKSLKGLIGYIPQDDLLIEELTVFQNLYYNAKLCFRDKKDQELQNLVMETLTNLGLSDKKDLKVGNPRKNIISGGQRKRLNIALELIREPSILFVDEPTSGLSSMDSENVMDLLRELTRKEKLIFVVIHQPSSDLFKMFDNLLLLDEGGRMIYYGNPVESVVYFKNLDAQINPDVGECPSCGKVNPEQLFNIIEKKVVDEFGRYTQKRKVSPTRWEAFFHSRSKSSDPDPVQSPIPKVFKTPPWFKQFKIFCLRDMLAKISNKQYLLLSFLEAPVLGFILSYIIRYIVDPESNTYIFRENENIPIYIFMSLIVALFIALTISAEEIFRDRKILKREKFLNLNKGSYLLAKLVILFLISAIQAYLFVIIGNAILGIRDMTFHYWAAFFTTAAFANLLGLNVSASFNSAITIYIIIPLLVIPMMVLSGAMFSFDKLNRTIGSVDKVPMVAEIMATRWTYEALMVHQFRNNKFEKHFYDLEKRASQASFSVSESIPALKKALNKTVSAYNLGTLSEDDPAKLELLRNEITRRLGKTPVITFGYIEQLNPAGFNSEVASAINQYLNDLMDHFNRIVVETDMQIDRIRSYMLKEDPALFNRLKDDYFNENLSYTVKKSIESNRIIEYKNKLVQQYHPIYQDPEPSGLLGFRTHFFSPEKYLFGKTVHTFWYNLLLVWVMTVFLFLALYFDLLKMVVLYFESLKFRK